VEIAQTSTASGRLEVNFFVGGRNLQTLLESPPPYGAWLVLKEVLKSLRRWNPPKTAKDLLRVTPKLLYWIQALGCWSVLLLSCLSMKRCVLTPREKVQVHFVGIRLVEHHTASYFWLGWQGSYSFRMMQLVWGMGFVKSTEKTKNGAEPALHWS